MNQKEVCHEIKELVLVLAVLLLLLSAQRPAQAEVNVGVGVSVGLPVFALPAPPQLVVIPARLPIMWRTSTLTLSFTRAAVPSPRRTLVLGTWI